MRVFLTGGSGFLGAHVARQLVAAGHGVRALVRRDGPRATTPPALPGLTWVEGDLLDAASLAAGAAGCEVVVHCGADVTRLGSPAARAHQRLVNVEGTRNVVAAALQVGARRLLHTSSVAALGCPAPGAVGDEELPYNWPPGLPYHESKRDGERLALGAGAEGLEVIVLSPTQVLGPDDPRRRLAPVVAALRSGLLRVAPPGGLTVADVRCVAEAHLAALTTGRPGQRYLLGGAHVTWRRLLELLAAALGTPGPLFTLPPLALQLAALPLGALEWLVPFPLGGAGLAMLAADRRYASTRAVAELGYRETPAEELVAATAEQYR